LTDKVRLYRRNGLIHAYTSITFDITQNTVYIYTDAGRICRPVFYRDSETGEMSFQSLANRPSFTWTELISGFNSKRDKDFRPNNYKMYELSELYENIHAESNPAKLKRFLEDKAVIDYIDTNESENALIAMNLADTRERCTHMEIHESLLLGVMGNLIIFPENNPSTRNAFSCGQSKQACSLYHTNHQVRMDKAAVVLVSGQVPLVKSRFLEYINHEGNPYGENAIVAVMCYTGYNVEDAMLVNEGALKRGLFRTTYYSTYEAHEEKTSTEGGTVETVFANIEQDPAIVGTKPGHDYSRLDATGLIRENTPVDDQTILIGQVQRSKTEARDCSKVPKKGQLGVVDKSFLTESEEGKRIAKVRLREMRIPTLGDKMASRAGQKGTIGLVIPEADMPFTKDGIRPDIIINPHAIPSRMTIGQFVECLGGKASASYGAFMECTAFNNRGSKIGVYGKLLSDIGYHSSGNEILYNGMNGQQIEAEIFMGPNYYMRLKHMVKDKVNYRALGPRTALTRQPVAGRANDGGLRIGEMERDSIISHGATNFLTESMMERGDKYYIAVCRTTGMIAVYNPSKNIFMSPMADGPLRFVGSLDGKEMNLEHITRFGRQYSVICVPYTFKLLLQELQTMNIQMRIITEDNIQHLETMTFSSNIQTLTNNASATPSTILTDIRAQLRTPATDIYEKRYNDRIETELPSETPTPLPEAAPEFSPPYIPSSPAYQPSPSEVVVEEPNPESPQYNPFAMFTPTQTGGGSTQQPEPNLSDKAREYKVGDKVHYRGDVLPTRSWTIDHIGDKIIKILPDMTEGLASNDFIKLVTAMDIYRATAETMAMNHRPSMMTNAIDAIQETSLGATPHLPIQPFVNFNPTIKIMNGGSDYSTGDAATTQPQPHPHSGGGMIFKQDGGTPTDEPAASTNDANVLLTGGADIIVKKSN
jgi:hypothetical protein